MPWPSAIRGDLDYWRRMIEFTGVKVE